MRSVSKIYVSLYGEGNKTEFGGEVNITVINQHKLTICPEWTLPQLNDLFQEVI